MDKNYRVEDTDDTIYIENDLANEYIGSIYTYKLKEAATKANTAQGLPEMIKIATSRHFRENNSEKHYRNAALGWYRYDVIDKKSILCIMGKHIKQPLFSKSLPCFIL